MQMQVSQEKENYALQQSNAKLLQVGSIYIIYKFIIYKIHIIDDIKNKCNI